MSTRVCLTFFFPIVWEVGDNFSTFMFDYVLGKVVISSAKEASCFAYARF